MALRWVDPLVDGLPELRGMYSRIMIMMNGRLDQTLLRIAHFLAQKGFLAMPVHASDPYDLSSLKAVLSHKHAAVQAGLGEFGVSNLLLTPQFGPRQRFVQLLTDADLRPDEPLNLGLCEKTASECDYACIRACPPKVIPAPPKGPDAMNGVVRNGIKIDKPGCSYYQDRGSPAHGAKRLHIPLRDVYRRMPGGIRDPQARDARQGDQTGEDDPLDPGFKGG